MITVPKAALLECLHEFFVAGTGVLAVGFYIYVYGGFKICLSQGESFQPFLTS